MTNRLVAVSNRLPSVKAAGEGEDPEVPVGGLASALFGVLSRRPDSMWFGWTGRAAAPGREGRLRHQVAGGVELVGMPLTPEEIDLYYLGFCNQTLWPLFHCFQGRVKLRRREEECYQNVQARIAAALLPLLRNGDLLWVHDYHLLLLGRELRRLGWSGRIGFFLHTPFPPLELWQILPDPRGMLEAMMSYDVVGFHTRGFRDNYVHGCAQEIGAVWDGAVLAAENRRQRVGVYPVGIDPQAFLPQARRNRSDGMLPVLGRNVRARRVILGVDRLDYTKGIPERFLGYEMFLRRSPQWRNKVVLVQVASPSRTNVADYSDQKRRVESLLGRINGELGEPAWVPLRYLYRAYPRAFLARLYGEADVCLVTPLRDGMNLVAKEFVAAQDPGDPGVLVLSRCAGAAERMKEAVIVNPYIPSDLARGLEEALAMPLAERKARHAALLTHVLKDTAAEWGRRFVEDLDGRASAPRNLRRTVPPSATMAQ